MSIYSLKTVVPLLLAPLLSTATPALAEPLKDGSHCFRNDQSIQGSRHLGTIRLSVNGGQVVGTVSSVVRNEVAQFNFNADLVGAVVGRDTEVRYRESEKGDLKFSYAKGVVSAAPGLLSSVGPVPFTRCK